MGDQIKTPPPKRKTNSQIINNKEYVEFSGIQNYNVDNLDYKDLGISEIIGILGENSVRYMVCKNDDGYKFVMELEGLIFNLNEFTHYRPAKNEEKKPITSYVKGALETTNRNFNGIMSIEDRHIIILRYKANTFIEEQYIITTDNYMEVSQYMQPYIIIKKSDLSKEEQKDISHISLSIRTEALKISNKMLYNVQEKIENIDGMMQAYNQYKNNFKIKISKEETNRNNILGINNEIDKMIDLQNNLIKITPLVEEIYRAIPEQIRALYFDDE